MIAELPAPETIDEEALAASLRDGSVDLVCVLGPTASGKTRYAVSLARRLGAEIISADSRQVYRGMDIGTGKDLSEYGDVPYHLIDIQPAGAKYNVYEFQKDFVKAYQDIRSRGRVPLLCGGTGLYIEAATCGYDFDKRYPTVDPALFPQNTFYIGTLVDRATRNATAASPQKPSSTTVWNTNSSPSTSSASYPTMRCAPSSPTPSTSSPNAR